MIKHPDEARAMGARGRLAIETEYNWESEARKLRTLYKTVLAAHLANKV